VFSDALKLELCRLAQETGLGIQVHYFLPGTSKWNKIERNEFHGHWNYCIHPQ